MSLGFLNGEEELNAHQIAWREQNWGSVKKLTDQFKETAANEFFYVLNQLNQNKQRVNVDYLENYSEYNVNSSLSQHIDCIFHVYEMNLLGDSLSAQMHYDYLLHSIRTGKRFGNGSAIQDPIEETLNTVFVACVAKFYEVNKVRAAEYIEHHFSDEQCAILKKRLWPLATEESIKDACPYLKKAEISKILNEIEKWK
ncbi:MAG: DNA polymerase clamp loader subunit A [Bacilli bacterium]